MMNNETISTKGKRINWMDNLRTIIILLVVLYHVGESMRLPACGVGSGSWMIPQPSLGLASWVLCSTFS